MQTHRCPGQPHHHSGRRGVKEALVHIHRVANIVDQRGWRDFNGCCVVSHNLHSSLAQNLGTTRCDPSRATTVQTSHLLNMFLQVAHTTLATVVANQSVHSLCREHHSAVRDACGLERCRYEVSLQHTMISHTMSLRTMHVTPVRFHVFH